MKARSRDLLIAATVGSGVLAAGLSLQTWEIPAPPGSRCGNGEPVYLWQGLVHLPKENLDRFWTLHEWDVERNAGLLLMATVAGLVTYRATRPRRHPIEAGDYADGVFGAVRDGRVG